MAWRGAGAFRKADGCEKKYAGKQVERVSLSFAGSL
jgi:hypothetical protein